MSDVAKPDPAPVRDLIRKEVQGAVMAYSRGEPVDLGTLGTLALVSIAADLETITEALTTPLVGATRGLPTMLELTVLFDLNVLLLARPVDAAGNATHPTLTWTSNNPSVVDVRPADDGLGCLCATMAPGEAIVTVSDGNMSELVRIVVEPAAVEAPETPTEAPAPADAPGVTVALNVSAETVKK